jgi:DNA-binding transcriptional MerR regulator
MVAGRSKVFTTEQVTALLGLEPEDKWRVTKFVQSREYGIKPSISEAAGPGSRRLYDLENVCEIGLALRLLETGLRPKVIGHVLKELGQEGRLSRKLNVEKDLARALYLGILVSPQVGKPLDVSRIQYVDFVEGFTEVEHAIEKIAEGLSGRGLAKPVVDVLVNFDVLLVAVGLTFNRINERLATMEAESVGGKS